LEQNRYPLFVSNPEQVTTIAHIEGQIDEPLAVRFPIGIGRVHVFVSKMRINQKVFFSIYLLTIIIIIIIIIIIFC